MINFSGIYHEANENVVELIEKPMTNIAHSASITLLEVQQFGPVEVTNK